MQGVEGEGFAYPFKGMVMYYMKVNGEEHFKFVQHNVCAEDMNDGKMEYAKFGKVGLNNGVSLSHSNILQRAHQRARFCITCARVGNFI
jgi:hypothetical protein